MAKRKIFKALALAFAIAFSLVFFLPFVPASASQTAPELEDIVSVYPFQQYILAFDIAEYGDEREPLSITIPLTYSSSEGLFYPVQTNDGSFTVEVSWIFDSQYNIVFYVDLSEIAQTYSVDNYVIYALTPGIYSASDLLYFISCDVPFNLEFSSHYIYPEILSGLVNDIENNYYKFTVHDYSLYEMTSQHWEYLSVFAPGNLSFPSTQHLNSIVLVTDSELRISSASPISELQFAVPFMDSEASAGYYYENLLMNWNKDFVVSEKVYVNFPDTLEWFADMAADIFGLQLFPGVTLGAVLLGFIMIPVVIVFLRLFAGG